MAEHRAGYAYGMDAELKAKEDAKFDPKLEAMAKGWLEELSGSKCQGELLDWLNDGVVLCKAINAIKPGAVKKFNENPTMPFKKMENIQCFLKACRTELGMSESDLFTTSDCYDQQSKVNTINGIINVSRAANKNGFQGPSIAPKESSGHKSGKWDGKATGANSGISKLNMGSAGIMERSSVDRSNDIGFGSTSAGTGDASSATKFSMGSKGIMERQEVSRSNDIDFGNKSSTQKKS